MSFIFAPALLRLTKGNLYPNNTQTVTLEDAVVNDNRCYAVLVTAAPVNTLSTADTLAEVTGDPTVTLAGGSIATVGNNVVVDFDDFSFTNLTTPSPETVVGVVVVVRLGVSIARTFDLPLYYSALASSYQTQSSGTPNFNVTVPSTGLFATRAV